MHERIIHSRCSRQSGKDSSTLMSIERLGIITLMLGASAPDPISFDNTLSPSSRLSNLFFSLFLRCESRQQQAARMACKICQQFDRTGPHCMEQLGHDIRLFMANFKSHYPL